MWTDFSRSMILKSGKTLRTLIRFTPTVTFLVNQLLSSVIPKGHVAFFLVMFHNIMCV